MFLSNCNWFQWMVIKIRSKLVETITSKHYFIIISIFCQSATDFDEWSSKTVANWWNQSPPNTIRHSLLYFVKLEKCSEMSNHLQTLYHTLQKPQGKPSQGCKRVWERKKNGQASSSHFSGSGQPCASFLGPVKTSMKLYPPPNFSFYDHS